MRQKFCSVHISEEQCLTDTRNHSHKFPKLVRIPIRIKWEEKEPLYQGELALFTGYRSFPPLDDNYYAYLNQFSTSYDFSRDDTQIYTFKKNWNLHFFFNGKLIQNIIQVQQHMSVGWIWLAAFWFSTSSWIYSCS